jgi:regulator of cell morphogenesis and NO signaling
MRAFVSSQTIGEIVSAMPKASEIFKAYNIDFCCGGHRPLAEAIHKQNLDEEETMSKLDEAYEEAKSLANQVDFRSMASSELIDYIVNKHHVYLGSALPVLSELTSKILRAHGANHPDLFKVHKLFHQLKTELDQHLIKEEELLFPLVKAYEANPKKELQEKVPLVMKEIEDEHEAAGDVLKELRRITQDYLVPEDGCGTYVKAFDKLQELEADLFQHIHLENNILSPRLQ